MSGLLNLITIITVSVIIFGVDSSTTVSIDGDNFKINGEITYKSAKYSEMQGLLMNSRMVNGIFDDYNQSTVNNFDYPDTHTWNATRNTIEFIGNLSSYKANNLLAVTVGLQGMYISIHILYFHKPNLYTIFQVDVQFNLVIADKHG